MESDRGEMAKDGAESAPGLIHLAEDRGEQDEDLVRVAHGLIHVDEDIVVDARPSEVDDTSFDKAAQTAADEEDIWRGAEPEKDEDDYDNYRPTPHVPLTEEQWLEKFAPKAAV